VDATDIIAVYGAIVATAVFVWDIYKWRISGARLCLSIVQNQVKDLRHIRVTATNRGNKQTTISRSAFLYYKGWISRAKSLLPLIQGKPDKSFPQRDTAFPLDIKCGGEWGIVILDEEIKEIPKQGLLFFALYESHRKKPKTIRIHLKK
jgi:hypothetical protein